MTRHAGPPASLSKLGFAEHDGGLRALKVREIAARDKKREIAGAGAIKRGDAVYHDVRRPDKPPAGEQGEISSRDAPSAFDGHGATLTGPCAAAAAPWP